MTWQLMSDPIIMFCIKSNYTVLWFDQALSVTVTANMNVWADTEQQQNNYIISSILYTLHCPRASIYKCLAETRQRQQD